VRARTLCTDARALTDDTLLLADLDRLRGRIEVNVGSAADAHRIFTQAAERVAHDDPVRALELAVAAAVAQSHGVDSGARLAVDTIDLVTTPQDAPRTRCLKFLLASARHDIDGDRAAALAQLHAALETAVNAPDALGDVDLLGNLANAALHLGDDDAHRRFYTLMLSTARANGDGIRVLYALQRLAFAQYLGGQWAALRSSSEEAVALGVSVGQSASTAAPRAWLALLAALQGHPDFDERLAAVEELVAAHPPVGILAQPVDDLLHWARGLHALLQGSAVEALHQFGRMQLPALTLIAAQDRIDAAIRAGSPAQAREWVRDLETFAAGTDVAWAQGAAAFGHAVAAANDEAPDGMPASQLFEASLAHHGAANRPYDRARVQLAFGEYLRRGQRRVDARTELRAALSAFEELHADPLADRARQELRASGETARKRDPSTQLDLTPMERTVAELVGQGLSNKDVAAQCWVSPRTVAFHLRNVFSKLGISSRAELAHLDLL
jgi:DNA-binding CsgD family transcriptional regulator